MRTIRSGSDLTATIIPFTMMRMFLVSLLFPFGEPLPAFWPRRGGGGSGSMMAHGEYGSPDEHLEQQLHQDGYLLEFQYVRQFMQDVFESYGVPPDRAAVCADVLLVADERGIHSHALGRLKPIYCDRMDAGILYPSQDIRVIKETETTALLDGNLGLGLYIGPFAMQMAIQKAKKYGVGFVAVKNSTHYGIAGYYTLMASQNNCIGWTGTNARPSIAPTFGVQPMMGTVRIVGHAQKTFLLTHKAVLSFSLLASFCRTQLLLGFPATNPLTFASIVPRLLTSVVRLKCTPARVEKHPVGVSLIIKALNVPIPKKS
mmetsp:Transcript_3202/g.6444  ORF Transcript_3202/g.6444 Transcript_3202/m.6444 type:complete len:316 (+) Transcript_3202:263-1210(+)